MLRLALVFFALAALLPIPLAAANESPQPHLKVSYRGEPVAVRTAYAIHDEASIKLFFSSATPSCQEVVAKSRMLAAGEISFEITRHQWSDGSTQLMTYFKGNTQGDPEYVVLDFDHIDAAEGAATSGRLSGLIQGIDDEIEVDGAFEAVTCSRPAED